MKLGIDLDGCLYDFVTDYHDYILEHGYAEEVQPVTDWDFYHDYGFTLDEFNEHLEHGAATARIFNRSAPVEGAVLELKLLHAEGHTIHIITDRGRFGVSAMVDTAQWLHDFEIPFDSLTFARDKTLVNVDLMVEDSPVNLNALEGTRVQTVKFDQPWNQGVDADWTIERWSQLSNVVTYFPDAADLAVAS